MLLSDVQTRVKRTFGDESGAQITDADITRWANDGQLDLVKRVKCNVLDYTTPAVVGQTAYPLTDFLDVADQVLFDGRPLRQVNRQQLNQWYPEGPGSTPNGLPLYYRISASGVVLAPPPDSTLTLSVAYIQRPPELVNPTDPLSIPVQYHEDVVRYCLLRAYELDGQWTAADRVKSDYKDRIEQDRHEEQNPGNESYPAVRVLPGDYGDWY